MGQGGNFKNIIFVSMEKEMKFNNREKVLCRPQNGISS